jgi:hypothetical protein
MYDHAELAAFLFYTAYLAIQVTFDYHCIRCFSVIPGSRSACFSMMLSYPRFFCDVWLSWYFFSADRKYRSVFLVAQIYLFFNDLSKYRPATFSINISRCRLAILFFLASTGFLTFLFWPLTVTNHEKCTGKLREKCTTA